MRRTQVACLSAMIGATLAIAGGSPAAATAPGGDGLRVFVDLNQILTSRVVAGDTQYRVLTTSGDNRHPRWSPDGKRIVYSTKHGAIRTMGPTGGSRRTVLGSGGYQPTWQSPTRIAFVKVVAGKGDIYSIAATGGTLTRITVDGAQQCGNAQPSFSYDGRYLAYIQRRPTAGDCANPKPVLKVVDRTTGSVRVITAVPDLVGGSGRSFSVQLDRTDFTASGRTVMFKTEDDGCVELWATLDVRTGALGQLDNIGCEGGSYYGSAYPTPEGGIQFGGDDGDIQPVQARTQP